MLEGLSLALPTLRNVADLLLSCMLGTCSMHDACAGVYSRVRATVRVKLRVKNQI